MFAQITTPTNPAKAIYYNEHKVKKNAAVCLLAENFLKDADKLDLRDKTERFKHLVTLNENVVRNTLHIFINFGSKEQLPPSKLIAITKDYMRRIGFGDQPYLVYQHFDVGHPHFHIVTTNIRKDGSTIDTFLIGSRLSNPARMEIEKKYGLVKARDTARGISEEPATLPLQKLRYGKAETLSSITCVLQNILYRFRYRSLQELNAILKLYNLYADPGKPGNWVNKHGGLMYQMLDDKGKRVGTPIKSSLIFFKPGLKWLEEKFKANRLIAPEEADRIRSAIDQTAQNQPKTWQAFADLLRQEKIEPVQYSSDQYGNSSALCFVDLEGKLVLNQGDLGAAYSLQGIMKQLGQGHFLQQGPIQNSKRKNTSKHL